MSDAADDAQDNIELTMAIALKAPRETGPQPTGYCLNCDTPVANDMRWCDHDCCSDWSKRRALNLHHG